MYVPQPGDLVKFGADYGPEGCYAKKGQRETVARVDRGYDPLVYFQPKADGTTTVAAYAHRLVKVNRQEPVAPLSRDGEPLLVGDRVLVVEPHYISEGARVPGSTRYVGEEGTIVEPFDMEGNEGNVRVKTKSTGPRADIIAPRSLVHLDTVEADDAPTFAEGDRVRITDEATFTMTYGQAKESRWRGKEGDFIADRGHGHAAVRLDSGIAALVDASGLEAILPEPEPEAPVFAVGDLATVKADPHWTAAGGERRPCTLVDLKEGALVKVVYGPEADGDVVVRLAEGNGSSRQVIHSSYLEPYVAPAITAPFAWSRRAGKATWLDDYMARMTRAYAIPQRFIVGASPTLGWDTVQQGLTRAEAIIDEGLADAEPEEGFDPEMERRADALETALDLYQGLGFNGAAHDLPAIVGFARFILGEEV